MFLLPKYLPKFPEILPIIPPKHSQLTSKTHSKIIEFLLGLIKGLSAFKKAVKRLKTGFEVVTKGLNGIVLICWCFCHFLCLCFFFLKAGYYCTMYYIYGFLPPRDPGQNSGQKICSKSWSNTWPKIDRKLPEKQLKNLQKTSPELLPQNPKLHMNQAVFLDLLRQR